MNWFGLIQVSYQLNSSLKNRLNQNIKLSYEDSIQISFEQTQSISTVIWKDSI